MDNFFLLFFDGDSGNIHDNKMIFIMLAKALFKNIFTVKKYSY